MKDTINPIKVEDLQPDELLTNHDKLKLARQERWNNCWNDLIPVFEKYGFFQIDDDGQPQNMSIELLDFVGGIQNMLTNDFIKLYVQNIEKS